MSLTSPSEENLHFKQTSEAFQVLQKYKVFFFFMLGGDYMT